MPHDHTDEHKHHPHPNDHNHADADHLRSHMHRRDEAADVQVLTDQFIDGFVSAKDKAAFLKIAGVPHQIEDPAGGPSMKLVDVHLTTEWQVGTASPSFGSRELSYLPYPGEMVTERTNLAFIYVSLNARTVTDLRAFMSERISVG